jgi:hypothetical protein
MVGKRPTISCTAISNGMPKSNMIDLRQFCIVTSALLPLLACAPPQDAQIAVRNHAQTDGVSGQPDIPLFSTTPTQSFVPLKPLHVQITSLPGHKPPTRAALEKRLRQHATRLGADAVIHVRLSPSRPLAAGRHQRSATGLAIRF